MRIHGLYRLGGGEVGRGRLRSCWRFPSRGGFGRGGRRGVGGGGWVLGWRTGRGRLVGAFFKQSGKEDGEFTELGEESWPVGVLEMVIIFGGW